MAVPTELEEQKKYILKKVEQGMIFLDNKHSVRFWWNALKSLEVEGKIKMELSEIEEQYSRLEVTKS